MIFALVAEVPIPSSPLNIFLRLTSVIAARALEVVSDGGARIYQSSGCTSADCIIKS
jgi:hypothetical protein